MNRPALVLALSLVLSWSSAAVAQSPSDVYDRVAPSVFVMEVRESGEVKGQATAFKIGPSRLLTNAHAVRGEQVWLRVGPVTVQAKVIRTDEINDLALLELDAELAAPSLEFSTTEMKPGIRVFAIGNPRGLERTIAPCCRSRRQYRPGPLAVQLSARPVW
jgi:serine protease Do